MIAHPQLLLNYPARRLNAYPHLYPKGHSKRVGLRVYFEGRLKEDHLHLNKLVLRSEIMQLRLIK